MIFAIVRSTGTTVILLAAYVLILPLGHFDLRPVVLLSGGLVLVGLAVAVQLRAIVRSRRADLRAIEAIGILLPVIVIVFSSVYLEMSESDPTHFTEPLTSIGSLYFAVTILTGVGFGDISPLTDAARVTVTIQMLVDLVLIAAVVRLIVAAVARSRANHGVEPDGRRRSA